MLGPKGSEEVTLEDSLMSLESDDATIVSVDLKVGTTDTWIVKAVSRGTTVVHILNEDQTVADTISVTVKNASPVRKRNADGDLDPIPKTLYSVNEPIAGDTIHTLTVIDSTGNVDLNNFFEDADVGTELSYTAVPSSPFIIVKDVKLNAITLDVVKKVGNYFMLTIHAVDDEMAISADSLELKVRTVDPLSHTVDVQQFENGDFLSAKIGDRQGVVHMLEFQPVLVDTPAGFAFAMDSDNSGTYVATLPAADADNLKYYTISRTGPVQISAAGVAEDMPFDDGTGSATSARSAPGPSPILRITVTRSGTAKITINYHESEMVPESSDPVAYRWRKTETSTLTLTVERVRAS